MNWQCCYSAIGASLILTALLTSFVPVAAQDGLPKNLNFSGYRWTVREQGTSGPGPNVWDSRNVWVDKDGNLHLKITHVKGANGDQWRCAELTSIQKFGFGQYEFQTVGRVDQFDQNVVLGLFDYPEDGQDPDGTNEIDIEFARWGNPKYPNGNFTIYPATGKRAAKDSFAFEYTLPSSAIGTLATHRFTRASSQVEFSTFAGAGKAGDKPLNAWTYAPGDKRLIPQKQLAIHLNLWLFGGKPPADGKEVEVILKKFSFTPAR